MAPPEKLAIRERGLVGVKLVVIMVAEKSFGWCKRRGFCWRKSNLVDVKEGDFVGVKDDDFIEGKKI